VQFERLEVKALRATEGDEFIVVPDDADAELFGLYGINGNTARPIGDFSTRAAAESIKDAISLP
jgi:hypothetical protein